MKVVALMASPFRQGNSDLLLDQAIKGCESKGAKVDKIYLAERRIPLCCGCFECRGTGECKQFSSINGLLRKINTADALLISTPVWWFNMSSQLKALLDHFLAFVTEDFSSLIVGKKLCILICCGGKRNSGIEETLSVLHRCFDFLGLEWVGEVKGFDLAAHGEVKNRSRLLKAAFSLGAKVAS